MSEHIHLIETEALGACWMAVSKKIMTEGYAARYDGTPIKEVANLSTVITHPDPEDPLIKEQGDPEWLDWMHENFFVQKEVAELGNADSYAVRLFNYDHQGRDQVQWVIDRLQQHREARSATITTFVPLKDTSYIPCISLLDFWIPHEALELVVYAHSLDFGKKAYGNLLELALLQQMVAQEVGCQTGKLIIHVKTAHIYEPEYGYMNDLIGKTAAAAA